MEGTIIICVEIVFIFLAESVSNPLYCNKCSEYSIEAMELYVPSLEKIVSVLKSGLYSSFENVEVSIVDCPDLTKKPFYLAGKGLNGCPTLVEVGSESYLIPKPRWQKVYDFKDINHQTGVNPALVIGAGAGPFSYLKTASELIANSFVRDGTVSSLTQVVTVNNETNEYVVQTLPDSVSTYAFMGNYFVCQGQPGRVIRIKCSKRIGENDFPNSIRKTLIEGFTNRSIGLGGTFTVTNSKVKQHVQPAFSTIPLVNQTMVDNWLQYHDMRPPLVAHGMLLTYDPGMDMRTSHFHSTSDHGEAGHYHYDLEPDFVEYLGYFNLAAKAVRIDKPPSQSESKLKGYFDC